MEFHLAVGDQEVNALGFVCYQMVFQRHSKLINLNTVA